MKRLDAKTQLEVARNILNEFGYTGNEKLMNLPTGSVDLARNWAADYAAGFYTDSKGVEHHDWDCMMCDEYDDASHECSGSPRDQFIQLVRVRKNKSGDYVTD